MDDATTNQSQANNGDQSATVDPKIRAVKSHEIANPFEKAVDLNK